MLFTQIDTKNISRLDWLTLRQSGIGGSDAAAVLGLNKWKSPIDVWVDKTTSVRDEEISEAAYWGTLLEDVVAKEFAARTGLNVRRRNFMLRNVANPFMLANIDREIVGQSVGLECKTCSEYRKDEWGENEIPVEYIVQCQHYMAVTGYNAWWIAVLIGGNKFVYKEIKRDEEIIQMLIEREKAFWQNYVLSKKMPPADGSSACTEALKKLYPRSNGEVIALDSQAAEALARLDKLKVQQKALDSEISAVENIVKAQLGEAETGEADGWRVSWKTMISQRVDSKLLKENYPDIYKSCCKESTSRRFTVKEMV